MNSSSQVTIEEVGERLDVASCPDAGYAGADLDSCYIMRSIVG